ncbi:MAG TPA: cytochrome P450 [Acidimicrobiaceae bacterium]|nr:cytochrome P450 [Acidimicrobiaceae bacterium]
MAHAAISAAEADRILAAAVLDDEARQDPLDAYRRLHEGSPRWTSASGATVVAGYHDCLDVLRRPKWGRAEADMELPTGLFRPRSPMEQNSRAMLLMNPPDHTRIRALVSRAFTPNRVEALRPRIEMLLHPLLDAAEERGQIELMEELAVPFPVAVISELLGVPLDETGRFAGLVRDTTATIDAAADEAALRRAEAAIGELVGYFLGLIEEKRSMPDEALLSALIEVEQEGDRLSIEELVANTLLLYAAGFETTSNLIGNGMWALLRNSDQMDLLRAEPELMGSAVTEILRYDSPVQLNVRTALETDELFGAIVGRGHQAIVLQGAANHDPEVYQNPARFDVTRFVDSKCPQPLSFGFGIHYCLGAHLARAEGEVVFSTLLERFSRIELAGPPPRYRSSFTLRGCERIELSLQV